MINAIKIQFPNDGNVYHVPLKSIAEIRAEYLAEKDGFEINSAEWYEEIDTIMHNHTMALDIVKKMDWDHLKEIMIYVDSNDEVSDKDEWLDEALEAAEFISSDKVAD